MSSGMGQKIGRGGAGNFYSEQDIDSASAVNDDIERQNHPENASALIEAQLQSTSYLRSGRGGAGNVIDPSQEKPSSSLDLRSDPRAHENSSTAGPGMAADSARKDQSATYRGLSGRGGAGNWVQTGDAKGKQRLEEEQLKSQVDEQVRLDVELGLKPPPKAYAALQSTHRNLT